MIARLTTWVERRRTPPTRRRAEAPVILQRSNSLEYLTACNTDPIPAARRQSLPIQRKRPIRAENEPKEVRRARKEMSTAAAALNAFSPDQRLAMLEMAAQLSNFRDAVAPRRVAMPRDARGPCVAHFELQFSATGDIFVEEKIRRRVSPAAIERKPAHVFSDDQMRRGKAQLQAAFLWQSAKETGFPEAPPEFRPLHLAASLSED